jgi:hypothetical protein
VSAGALAACGEPTAPVTSPAPETTATTSSSPAPEQRHVLEVAVTGTAVLTSLTFTLDGKATEEKDVALPWTRTVEVPFGGGRHEWGLTLRYGGGDVAATGTVDGKPLTQTTGSGSPGSDNTADLGGSFTD